MRPLSRKILEAGLVEKHAAKLFERWGQLEPGSANLVGQRMVTEVTLAAFADDIESLLANEEENDHKATVLEVNAKLELDFIDPAGNKVHCWVDYMGHLIVPVSRKVRVHRGSRIQADGKTYTVLDIDTVYQNDDMVALQLTVSKPE